MGSQIDPARARISLVGSGYCRLSRASISESQTELRECTSELGNHTVSLESHKDNLVLCNLVCSAQVLVHVSTRGKTKV